jgi:cytochrome P450
MASAIIIQAFIAFVSFVIYRQIFRNPKKNLPPGPRGLPLIGNVFDLPPKGIPDYIHWKSLTDKYGPIASVTVLGRHLIFIADEQDAREVMEKKSSVSSGRPAFEFSKYSGFGDFAAVYQPSKEFKVHRKLMHRGLGTKLLVSRYANILELHAGLLLQETLKAPEQMLRYLEKYAIRRSISRYLQAERQSYISNTLS